MSTRALLLTALFVLGFLLWGEWQKDYGQRQVAQPAAQVQQDDPLSTIADTPDVPNAADIPDVGQAPTQQAAQQREEPTPTAAPSSTLVTAVTDLLEIKIDTVGGTVVSASLLAYPLEVDTPDIPVTLLQRDGNQLVIAQSGLLSSNNVAPNHTATFTAAETDYRLQDGEQELRIPLTWRDDSGLTVTKTFILNRGSYVIDTIQTVDNQTGAEWQGNRYEQIQRGPPPAEKPSFTDPGRYSYLGAAVYSPDNKFEKLPLDEFTDEPFQATITGGWAAMVQHYFFSAWIPPANQPNAFSTDEYHPGGFTRYIIRTISPAVQVAPGESHDFSARLYVGPKLQQELDEIAPGLALTVDYGIFTIFSKPLYWLLSKIHSFVGNWGWAIIFLTILIKLAFFKLSEAQYKSAARMRKLQPRINALRERYGDDRQKFSQAMMEIYRKEKVNPLGGCLPILVQIPIFIALYWVLLESVELRQAPFFAWIQNLSAPDPYFVLPAINGIGMWLTQKMTPAPGMDPTQQKVMQMLPIIFAVMFAFFPAGLVLYWATNSIISLLQQWVITRRIDRMG